MGEVTWAASNHFDAIGLLVAFVFLAPCIDAKFECVIYLVEGANGSSVGSHFYFLLFY